jgi:hypothetical protein
MGGNNKRSFFKFGASNFGLKVIHKKASAKKEFGSDRKAKKWRLLF